MVELVVVRHGETEWNVQSRQQGQMDSLLTERGQRQAVAVAGRLANQPFDVLYSSDLGRAKNTAQVIATATGKSLHADDRLRERRLGVFEGLTRAECRQQHARHYEDYQRGGIDYRMPGGESARDRFDRTMGCLDELVERHPGQRLVVVTHGGTLNGLFRRCVGLSMEAPRTFALLNGSLNVCVVDERGWSLRTWGDVAHLVDIPTSDDTTRT